MNKVCLNGRICNDLELRDAGEHQYTRFNVAVNRRTVKEDGLLDIHNFSRQYREVSKDPEAMKRLQEIEIQNGPKMYSAPVTIGSGAININVQNGDPNTIAMAVKTAMTKIFSDYNKVRYSTEMA